MHKIDVKKTLMFATWENEVGKEDLHGPHFARTTFRNDAAKI